MSSTGPVGEAERGELLSALLDGELTPAEEAEVRAWLDVDPDARAELEGLTAVRSAVRSLPPVDPPFGFYERMLRDGAGPSGRTERAAPRRWRGGGLVAAAASILVALVLVVGVTPPAEAMVPPVDRYTARHEAMTMGAVGVAKGSAPSGTSPGGLVTSTTSGPTSTARASTTTEAALGTLASRGGVVGEPATSATTAAGPGGGSAPTSSRAPGTTTRPPATAPPGSTAVPTTTATGSTGGATTTSVLTTGSTATAGGYEPVDLATLAEDDPMVGLARGGEVTPTAAYRGPGGVLHVVYVDAGTPVSLYEEPGMVEWARLPDAGKRVEIGGDPAWWMRAGPSEVLVVEKGGMVFTLIGATSHEDMIELGDALPPPADPSWTGRLQRAAEDCSRRFGFGG